MSDDGSISRSSSNGSERTFREEFDGTFCQPVRGPVFEDEEDRAAFGSCVEWPDWDDFYYTFKPLKRDRQYYYFRLLIERQAPDCALRRIGFYLRKATNCPDVTISCEMYSGDVPQLFRILFETPIDRSTESSLKSLSLSGKNTCFGLGHSPFWIEDANAVFNNYLHNTPQLNVIQVRYFDMKPGSLGVLMGFLRQSLCKYLSFWNIIVERGELIDFLSSLNSTCIENFSFTGGTIGLAECEALSSSLREKTCVVKDLRIHTDIAGDQCVNVIINSFQENESVLVLSLGSHQSYENADVKLERVLFNKSSLNGIYDSNHTLNKVVSGFTSNPQLKSSLRTNRCPFKWIVRRKKIFQHLTSGAAFDTTPFYSFDLDVLPYALAYACRKCPEDLGDEEIGDEDEDEGEDENNDHGDAFLSLDMVFQVVRGLDVEQVFGKVPISGRGGQKRTRHE